VFHCAVAHSCGLVATRGCDDDEMCARAIILVHEMSILLNGNDKFGAKRAHCDSHKFLICAKTHPFHC